MKVAGFGFRGATTAESLRNAYEALGGDAEVFAAPADKAEAACLKDFARDMGIPIQPISTDAMQVIDTPTQAARVIEKRGTGSVAEACALAAAGAKSRLLAERHISQDRMATCALAVKDET
ncbi:MAG: cobalamin biosynthesis protein [Cognatishimia sp.]|uniref:cobalamin biosynthesis protein n=1 Tax=Cognatishimia sp. TaxID=2211648 RepID=UPI0040584675